jgi:hypothetical protein
MEHALHGQRNRRQCGHNLAYLAQPRPQAPFEQDFQRLQYGLFKSVDELVCAVELFVFAHNENPKPFIWTASARDILEKVMRAKTKLNTVQTA